MPSRSPAPVFPARAHAPLPPAESRPKLGLDALSRSRPVYCSCLFSAVAAAVPLTTWAAEPTRAIRVGAALSTDAARDFRIPAGDATESLAAFTRQSSTPVIYIVEQVRGVRTRAVEGRLPPRAALEQLVANTDLMVVNDPRSGALMIKRLTPSPKTPMQKTAAVAPRLLE